MMFVIVIHSPPFLENTRCGGGLYNISPNCIANICSQVTLFHHHLGTPSSYSSILSVFISSYFIFTVNLFNIFIYLFCSYPLLFLSFWKCLFPSFYVHFSLCEFSFLYFPICIVSTVVFIHLSLLSSYVISFHFIFIPFSSIYFHLPCFSFSVC